MFAANGTRHDISQSVNHLNMFNSNPGKVWKWNSAKRMFRYLEGTISMRLTYSKKGNSKVIGFCYADRGSDMDECPSVTDYVTLLQGESINWNSKHQQLIDL